jgi:hypothetical protein
VSSSRPADRITARNDNDAKRRFLRFLQESLTAVHSTAQWFVAPVPGGQGLQVAETRPNALPLRCGDRGRLYLWSTIQYEYVDHPNRQRERKVKTRYYTHTLTTDEAATNEQLSWQWHPLTNGPRYPHLHVHGHELLGKSLHKLHLPTGRVFLEDVLTFLIEDVGVKPARDDWQDVLERNLRLVNAHGTWGTRPA